MHGAVAPNGGNVQLQNAVNNSLQGASHALIFDSSHNVLALRPTTANFAKEDLVAIETLYTSGRESAVRGGLVLHLQRFEVHRYDDALVYGRTATDEAQDSLGFAVVKSPYKQAGNCAIAFIQFSMPQLTATMVPALLEFCQTQFGVSQPSTPPEALGAAATAYGLPAVAAEQN